MVTAYFLCRLDGLGSASNPGPWAGVVAGQKGDAYTVGVNPDECGTYYDGADYTSSNTFSTSNLVYARSVLFVDTANQKPTHISGEVYFTSQQGNGKKFTSIALYKEDTNDDAQCVDDFTGASQTYYKYSATQD